MNSGIRKTVEIGLLVFSAASILAACGENKSEQADVSSSKRESNNKKSGTTLEFMTTWTGDRKDKLTTLLSDFTDETGIKVDLVTPGNDYETVMKTRMASRDLPDVWETHGWSVARYKEYLMSLNDEKWASRMDDAIKPVIMDTDDKFYTAPITMGLNTITYSKDAFDKAEVKAEDIRTWDDFSEACEKLKGEGITPIYIGNKDDGSAQLAEAIPPTYLTNEDVKENQIDSLQDGSFDFDQYWTPISKLVSEWNEKKYFNVDLLTADNESGTKELAQGEAGMMFGGSNNISQALSFNPDAKLGILASPSAEKDGKSSMSTGEGFCVGIWKDTKHEKEAKQLLEYLTKTESISKLASAAGDLPGFTDVDNPDDYITKAYRETKETFDGDILYLPLFDREYLPSGMWDDLTNSFTAIFTNPGEKGVKESVSILEEAYEQKIN